MTDAIQLRHSFVEFIPEELDERVLYISLRFGTASHLCCCGCGAKVVTPIRPTDWKVIFDGKTVSLDPSIGNWRFECRSHYWIWESRVVWAPKWSQERVELAHAMQNRRRDAYFSNERSGDLASEDLAAGDAKVEQGSERTDDSDD